jgi:hypothetical protein
MSLASVIWELALPVDYEHVLVSCNPMGMPNMFLSIVHLGFKDLL